MKWVKVLALVLGSVWFFPVSCTSTLFYGIGVVADFDARDVARGDHVHSGFSVVVEPGEDGKPFRLVPLLRLQRLRAKGEAYSLLMPKPSDRIDVNDFTHVSYRVLENHDGLQKIEVEDNDDDGTIWSQYSVTRTDVAPLTSRMYHVGYMFGAFPYAFGAALLLYGIGRFLRWRLRIASVTSNDS